MVWSASFRKQRIIANRKIKNPAIKITKIIVQFIDPLWSQSKNASKKSSHPTRSAQEQRDRQRRTQGKIRQAEVRTKPAEEYLRIEE